MTPVLMAASDDGELRARLDHQPQATSTWFTWQERDPDPVRVRSVASAILLVAGDKGAQWNRWYERAIPHAEHLYDIYLKERGEEEAGS